MTEYTGTTENNSGSLTLQKLHDAYDAVMHLPAVSTPTRLGFPTRIIENPILVEYVTEQTKFPRSKKKRLRKKFRKLWTKSRAVPDKTIFFVGGGIAVCHPETAKMLRRSALVAGMTWGGALRREH
jgi:hypothetical protein